MRRFRALESGALPPLCSLTGQIVLTAAEDGGIAGWASKLLLLKQVLFNLKFPDSCIVLDAYLLLLETGCASMQSGTCRRLLRS
jgi:hypothetical protein